MPAVRITHQCAITRQWRLGASLRLSLGAAGVKTAECGFMSTRSGGRPREASNGRCDLEDRDFVFARRRWSWPAEVPLVLRRVARLRSRACGDPRSRRAGSHRSRLQARGDARHLPRAALQPGRSACRTAARARLDDPATASADQLRAVWGPFVGEAGTFEVNGTNAITMQATVAKNPAAMTKGADERLYLPARRRRVDADPDSHPCGAEFESDHRRVDPRRVMRRLTGSGRWP